MIESPIYGRISLVVMGVDHGQSTAGTSVSQVPAVSVVGAQDVDSGSAAYALFAGTVEVGRCAERLAGVESVQVVLVLLLLLLRASAGGRGKEKRFSIAIRD